MPQFSDTRGPPLIVGSVPVRPMNEAIRDCLVTYHEDLIDTLTLPDPNDRHVLAAAIRADAKVIVTYNL